MTAPTPDPTYPWLRCSLRRNPDFAFRKIEDEGIVIPIRVNEAKDNRMYTLNPTGTRFYDLIDGLRTGEEIRSMLLREFDVEEPELTKDLHVLLSQLESVRCIEIGDAQ